jgi:hypothetical protein
MQVIEKTFLRLMAKVDEIFLVEDQGDRRFGFSQMDGQKRRSLVQIINWLSTPAMTACCIIIP